MLCHGWKNDPPILKVSQHLPHNLFGLGWKIFPTLHISQHLSHDLLGLGWSVVVQPSRFRNPSRMVCLVLVTPLERFLGLGRRVELQASTPLARCIWSWMKCGAPILKISKGNHRLRRQGYLKATSNSKWSALWAARAYRGHTAMAQIMTPLAQHVFFEITQRPQTEV